MTALLVALGAAIGAPLRYLLSVHFDRRWPWGIWLANVSGSFLLGLVASLDRSTHVWALVGIGLCGAFTTYSTFAVQVVKQGPARGALLALVTVVGAVLGASVGAAVSGV